MNSDTPRVLRRATAGLDASEVSAIRELLRLAFAGDGEGFTDDDWEHATGGTHVVVESAGRIVAHASVVERTLFAGEQPLRAGYVEGVATHPQVQGQGFGTLAMRAANEVIEQGFEFGALSTGSPGFYERLGWRPWRGPTAVRTPAGPLRTPDDDGGVLTLTTPFTPILDPTATLSCEWRTGDVW